VSQRGKRSFSLHLAEAICAVVFVLTAMSWQLSNRATIEQLVRLCRQKMTKCGHRENNLELAGLTIHYPVKARKLRT
jgi:hypothetical protein